MSRVFATALLIASTVTLVSAASAQDGLQDARPDTLLDYGPSEVLVIDTDEGELTFDVEVADTLPEQAQGMMWREAIPDMTGMLFEFDEPKIATIWMKNTPLPLDIIFVRSNGRILKIEHNAQPYKLRSASSEAPVAAVLELAGGQSRDLGIMPGDTIRHEFFGTAN